MPTLIAALLLVAQDDLYRNALRELRHPPADVDQVLGLCRKFLEDPAFDPNAFVPGDARRRGSVEVRGEAQYLLAGTLEAAGRVDAALEAYLDCARKYPRPSYCGNGQAKYGSETWMGQARCLERLGRHAEAIDLYFKVSANDLSLTEFGAGLRIVELYEAAGKLDELRPRLDQHDREERASMLRSLGPETTGRVFERYKSSTRIRVLLEIVDEERAGRWEDLIRRLDSDLSEGPRVFEAAHRLARHPKVTLPLLVAELARREPGRRRWICYALGMCGGPEAVLTLRKGAESWPDSGNRRDALRGLDLCGAQGRAVLRALYAGGHDSLKWVIKDVYGKTVPQHPEGAAFSPIPEDLRLR